MPYIKREQRKNLRTYALSVQKELQRLAGPFPSVDTNPGDLNYFLSVLITNLFLSDCNYKSSNKLRGVLDDVKHEFTRRYVDPYEDMKRMQNGDIP